MSAATALSETAVFLTAARPAPTAQLAGAGTGRVVEAGAALARRAAVGTAGLYYETVDPAYAAQYAAAPNAVHQNFGRRAVGTANDYYENLNHYGAAPASPVLTRQMLPSGIVTANYGTGTGVVHDSTGGVTGVYRRQDTTTTEISTSSYVHLPPLITHSELASTDATTDTDTDTEASTSTYVHLPPLTTHSELESTDTTTDTDTETETSTSTELVLPTTTTSEPTSADTDTETGTSTSTELILPTTTTSEPTSTDTETETSTSTELVLPTTTTSEPTSTDTETETSTSTDMVLPTTTTPELTSTDTETETSTSTDFILPTTTTSELTSTDTDTETSTSTSTDLCLPTTAASEITSTSTGLCLPTMATSELPCTAPVGTSTYSHSETATVPTSQSICYPIGTGDATAPTSPGYGYAKPSLPAIDLPIPANSGADVTSSRNAVATFALVICGIAAMLA